MKLPRPTIKIIIVFFVLTFAAQAGFAVEAYGYIGRQMPAVGQEARYQIHIIIAGQYNMVPDLILSVNMATAWWPALRGLLQQGGRIRYESSFQSGGMINEYALIEIAPPGGYAVPLANISVIQAYRSFFAPAFRMPAWQRMERYY